MISVFVGPLSVGCVDLGRSVRLDVLFDHVELERFLGEYKVGWSIMKVSIDHCAFAHS